VAGQAGQAQTTWAGAWQQIGDRYDPAPMLNRSRASRRPARRAGLQPWLRAPGSLTARLRQHGPVSVAVLFQGHARLWPQERQALRSVTGHVREVVLRVDGCPAVWARSCTPLRAVKGPWRAIKGLGTRPLAELLFAQRQVRREPLLAERLPRHGPAWTHLARQWARLPEAGDAAGAPCWSRRSVFRHRGHPLQVLEAFAAWVGNWPTR